MSRTQDTHAPPKPPLRAISAVDLPQLEAAGPTAEAWSALLFREPPDRVDPQRLKRLITAAIVVVFLHGLFLFFVAPRIGLEHQGSRTEVVQISQDELQKMKEAIARNQKMMGTLRPDELREEYKTKEAPKDAQMFGPHNQSVPKESTTGPRADDPREGGGNGKSRAQSAQAAKPKFKMNLSQLGLGSKLPPETPNETEQPQQHQQSEAGPQGPRGPYVPRGLGEKQTGRENLLNAVENEFYSFFLRLDEPITQNWRFLVRSNEGQIRNELVQKKAGPGAEFPVILDFSFDREGNFREITVVQSSGIPMLDWTVREAVRKLKSIPNPPKGLFEGKPYYTRRLGFVLVIPSAAPLYMTQPDLYW